MSIPVTTARPARIGWPQARLAIQVGVLVVLVAVWQWAAARAGSVFFPPPSEIAQQMRALFVPETLTEPLTPAVQNDVLRSLGRMAAGWSIAVVIGVAAGIAIGRSRSLGQYVDPVINFLRSTPGPALLPVFLIVAGSGTTMRVSLIAFGTVWPVLLNTIEGVRSQDRTQWETAQMFGLPWRARIFSVLIPSSAPRILAGMHVAMTLAFVLMVVSELTVATDGIGYQINSAVQMYAFADMWAWLVLLAVLGLLVNAVFVKAEGRVLRWHRASRGQE